MPGILVFVFCSLLAWSLNTAADDDNPLPSLGDAASAVVSPEQEYRLGRAWLRKLRAQVATLEDPLIFDYLESTLYLLASNSDLRNPNLALVVLNDSQINAFAVPGGVIGLNAGLLIHAKTEDELAAVIAHELAHLSQRHFARGQERGQRSQWLTAAALLASVVLATQVGSDAGMAALATTQAAHIDQRLRFSRQNEKEADRIGMQTLVRAQMNPQAMPDFFAELLKSSRYRGKLPPAFLLTHPITQARISDSKNRAARMPKPGPRGDNLEFRFMQIRTQVAFNAEQTRAVAELEARLKQSGHQFRDVNRYGLAYAYQVAHRFDDALTTLQPLLRKYPNRITLLYTQASIYMAKNDYKQALAVLDKALRFSPGNYPLSLLKTESLLRSGQAKTALKLLKPIERQQPDKIRPWQLLAEAYGKTGDNLGVHQARAEYYFLSGHLAEALEQLTFAADVAGQDYLRAAQIKERTQAMIQSENDLRL